MNDHETDQLHPEDALNAQFDALLHASEQTYAMAEEQEALRDSANVFDTMISHLPESQQEDETFIGQEIHVQTPVFTDLEEEEIPMQPEVNAPAPMDLDALISQAVPDEEPIDVQPEPVQETELFTPAQETTLFDAAEKTEAEQPEQPQDEPEEEPSEEPSSDTQPQKSPKKKKGLFTRLIEWIEEDDDDPYADEEEEEEEEEPDRTSALEDENPDTQLEAELSEVQELDELSPEELQQQEEPSEKSESKLSDTAEFAAVESTDTEQMPETEAVNQPEEQPEVPDDALYMQMEQQPEPEFPPELTETQPVISEQEFAAFLEEVEADTEKDKGEPKQIFEKILRENDLPTEEEKQRAALEKFPDKETTLYFDVTLPKSGAQSTARAQVFDIEQEQEPEPPKPKAPEKKKNVEWMSMNLEQLCKIAPPLSELRLDGPVMAREVAREKQWIVSRYRAYLAEQKAQEQPVQTEQPPKPEQPEPMEQTEMPEQPEPQPTQPRSEEGRDPVFLQRSTDTPETESGDLTEKESETPVHVQPEHEAKAESDSGMEEEMIEIPISEETLPPEQNPASQKKKTRRTPPNVPANEQEIQKEMQTLRGKIQSKKIRSRIVAVLAAVMIYISCVLDFILPLPLALNYTASPHVVLLILMGLQLLAMAIAYDTIADGVRALLQLKPDYATLTDCMLLLNLVHCAARLASEGEELPYPAIAVLILFAVMRAEVSQMRAMQCIYKTASGSEPPQGLYVHEQNQRTYLVKAPLSDTAAFLSRTLEAKRLRQQQTVFVVLSIVIFIVLSILVCVMTGDFGRLPYALAASSTGACELALLYPSAVGTLRAARHMMKHGTAVCGLDGAHEMRRAQTLVLSDEDVFPKGSVTLERIDMRGSLNTATVIAYAIALAGQSSLGSMLREELHTRYGAQVRVQHVVRYADGGLGGRIGGQTVLLGSPKFIQSRGIPVPDAAEQSLVLLVGHEIAAVFDINYTVSPAQYNAMQILLEHHIQIELNSRNQQVTPVLVEQLYGLEANTIGTAELELGRAAQRGTLDEQPAGYLAYDSMVSMVECVATAQTYSRLGNVCMVLGMTAAVLGMLLMAYFCYLFVPADARPIRVLIYMLCWLVPTFFITNEIGRE